MNRKTKYQNITIETAVPYELEPTQPELFNPPGVKIVRYGQLDIIHQIGRYSRLGMETASNVALRGLKASFNVVDTFIVEAQTEIDRLDNRGRSVIE